MVEAPVLPEAKQGLSLSRKNGNLKKINNFRKITYVPFGEM